MTGDESRDEVVIRNTEYAQLWAKFEVLSNELEEKNSLIADLKQNDMDNHRLIQNLTNNLEDVKYTNSKLKDQLELQQIE